MLDDFNTELKRIGGGAALTLVPAQESPRVHSVAREKGQDNTNEVENSGSTSHRHRDVVERSFITFNMDS
jgi:hypothetical protein